MLSHVLREGGMLALIGLGLGAVLSAAMLQLLQNVVTETKDLPAMLPATVGAVLMLAVLAASSVPARRATLTSPVDVMRSE